jgi:FKBP-type peptidyl-prolyl cis-trans isomerase
MKSKLLLGVFIALVVIMTSCKDKNNETAWQDVTLEDNMDTSSYVFGMDFAKNYLVAQSIDIDPFAFLQGMLDVLDEEKEPLFNDEEHKRIFMQFQQDLQKNQQEKQLEKAVKNKEDGLAFLEANKAKEGVIETATGLQYKIIAPGSEEKPKATDVVKVHYTGKLIDGSVFDSSVERGEPVEFPLNRVIPGWTEGMQLIGKGGKIELYIKSDLAYGDQGAGPQIPGGSLIIFEVELLDILPEMPQE